jgi:hypothetical protein
MPFRRRRVEAAESLCAVFRPGCVCARFQNVGALMSMEKAAELSAPFTKTSAMRPTITSDSDARDSSEGRRMRKPDE